VLLVVGSPSSCHCGADRLFQSSARRSAVLFLWARSTLRDTARGAMVSQDSSLTRGVLLPSQEQGVPQVVPDALGQAPPPAHVLPESRTGAVEPEGAPKDGEEVPAPVSS